VLLLYAIDFFTSGLSAAIVAGEFHKTHPGFNFCCFQIFQKKSNFVFVFTEHME